MVNPADIESLSKLNIATLEQLQNVLTRMDQQLYTEVNAKGNASVGQHVRHTLEFYKCLFNATDVVSYDQRKRDLLMESSPEHAIGVTQQILEALQQPLAEKALKLNAKVATNESIGFALPSSFSRELFYVLEHAIHHMALIRMLVKDQKEDFELDDSFGVAYSTLVYRAREAHG